MTESVTATLGRREADYVEDQRIGKEILKTQVDSIAGCATLGAICWARWTD